MTQHSHLISKKSRLIRVFSLNRLRVFSNNFNDFFSIVSTHIVIKPKCCLMLKQRQNCFEAEWKVATKHNLCRNSSTCLYSWLISQVSHTNDNNKTNFCSPSSASWCTHLLNTHFLFSHDRNNPSNASVVGSFTFSTIKWFLHKTHFPLRSTMTWLQ